MWFLWKWNYFYSQKCWNINQDFLRTTLFSVNCVKLDVWIWVNREEKCSRKTTRKKKNPPNNDRTKKNRGREISAKKIHTCEEHTRKYIFLNSKQSKKSTGFTMFFICFYKYAINTNIISIIYNFIR